MPRFLPAISVSCGVVRKTKGAGESYRSVSSNAARASENGVFAAELASQGFTGGDNGLDGQWGFFQVLGDGADPKGCIGRAVRQSPGIVLPAQAPEAAHGLSLDSRSRRPAESIASPCPARI